MPNPKSLLLLLILTSIHTISAHGSNFTSLVERDVQLLSQTETLRPHPLEIGPVVEPNGIGSEQNIGPVVEPNGWRGLRGLGISERTPGHDQTVPLEGLLETGSSTIVEPNG